jgi:hypothetical protein
MPPVPSLPSLRALLRCYKSRLYGASSSGGAPFSTKLCVVRIAFHNASVDELPSLLQSFVCLNR